VDCLDDIVLFMHKIANCFSVKISITRDEVYVLLCKIFVNYLNIFLKDCDNIVWERNGCELLRRWGTTDSENSAKYKRYPYWRHLDRGRSRQGYSGGYLN